MMKPSAGVVEDDVGFVETTLGTAPSGSLPIFTSKAGRCGTLPPGAGSSVSGQIAPLTFATVVVVAAGAVVVVVVEIATGLGLLPLEATTPSTTPATASTTTAAITLARRWAERTDQARWAPGKR